MDIWIYHTHNAADISNESNSSDADADYDAVMRFDRATFDRRFSVQYNNKLTLSQELLTVSF